MCKRAAVVRDWLWWHLVIEDNQEFVDRMYWDNLQQMLQCNGAHDMTGSDGYVNIIDG